MFGRASDDWTADISLTHAQSAALSFPILCSLLIRPCFGLLPLVWIAMTLLYSGPNVLDISTNRRRVQIANENTAKAITSTVECFE